MLLSRILPKWGVTFELVKGNDQRMGQSFKQVDQVVFIETPSNPLMEIVDIAMVSDLAHQVGNSVADM